MRATVFFGAYHNVCKFHVLDCPVPLILGMQFNAMELGYSYDFTISDLGNVSGGAHEFSIRYDLDVMTRSKIKRKDKFIPCPTFMK